VLKSLFRPGCAPVFPLPSRLPLCSRAFNLFFFFFFLDLGGGKEIFFSRTCQLLFCLIFVPRTATNPFFFCPPPGSPGAFFYWQFSASFPGCFSARLLADNHPFCLSFPHLPFPLKRSLFSHLFFWSSFFFCPHFPLDFPCFCLGRNRSLLPHWSSPHNPDGPFFVFFFLPELFFLFRAFFAVFSPPVLVFSQGLCAPTLRDSSAVDPPVTPEAVLVQGVHCIVPCYSRRCVHC